MTMTVLEIVQLDQLPDATRSLAEVARVDDFLAVDRLVRDFETGSSSLL